MFISLYFWFLSDICGTSTLFMMLSDLFDSITLDQCDSVFKFVEERVSLWKSDTFYNAGKNYLLRMCNDLLRRLSKSQNTVFCGRIHLFLAQLFPLSERSGLNLMSQFNLENVTLYNTKAEDYDELRKSSVDEKEESMDIEEGEMQDSSSAIPIDYQLYRKFWSLQDFFRKPIQCYDKNSWKAFEGHTADVLNCFTSFKLDEMQISDKRSKKSGRAKPSQNFFAKYLTSEKLLDLQLSDSNFRRYVLIQFLIMFQYLHTQVKFKSPAQTLSEDQTTFIKDIRERILKMLQETPPDGPKFAKTIEHILAREEYWNRWKNEGCQSYVRQLSEDDCKARSKFQTKHKRKNIGDDLKASGGKLMKLGNSELTRLWNLCPDNLDACRLESRNFMPTLREYFEESIDQADPESGIEAGYKLTENSTFGWKSLRVLAHSSPHFFAQPTGGSANQGSKKMTEYLDSMVQKIIDEKAVAEGKGKEDVDADKNLDNTADMDDNLEDKDDASTRPASPAGIPVTEDLVSQLSQKLEKSWKSLGTELGLNDEEIQGFEAENSKTQAQALSMLTAWMEGEGERATVSVLEQALREIGQQDLANEISAEQGSPKE
ncbi:hypothetical protein CAPTEDRAFT_184685 [Capitella teleta]|uniref:Death domain-containing protein n=1 Tax=Capitella teleta TaxID=283909 RepID=R7VJJ3_CAPTE|nr:hypothetical protein CAPTEDRAFT_184685 [Capitella teleta]|eukprot:ELU18757.1 hypothetical protein CAPTEDRAFT_184685 [Capitella teleta]